MHSFIIAGGEPNSRRIHLENLCSNPAKLIHLVAEKSSLTIQQIQDLSRSLSISPRLPRIVWIEEANLLTTAAQNALLKMLEEPPESTTFYLTCNTSSSLLPTLRSRCTFINLPNLSNVPNSTLLSELKSIMSLSAGDRLMTILKRERSESILWLAQIESALTEKFADPSLTKTGAKTLAKIASLALQAHTQLLANCSVGLVTQNFYLRLPKIK